MLSNHEQRVSGSHWLNGSQGPEVERVNAWGRKNYKQRVFGFHSLNGRQGCMERGRNNKDTRKKKVFPFVNIFVCFIYIYSCDFRIEHTLLIPGPLCLIHISVAQKRVSSSGWA
jgi:hypothetical protein